jgi:hypothetical protein
MDLIQDPPGTLPPSSYRALAALWMFADMMLDLELRNRVVDITFAKSTALQNFAAPETFKDSPLRTLHVDMFTSFANADGLEKRKRRLPHDLTLELASRYMKEEQHENLRCLPSRKSTCSRYHVHRDGSSCGD